MSIRSTRIVVRERLRQAIPSDPDLEVSDLELVVLLVCNLVTTIGLAGDISRHLRTPDELGNDFLSGWHLVLYGGVMSVGIWLGVGALRHGLAFLPRAPLTTIGFLLLSLGGVADAAWHERFGTEARVEALVSPPHLVVFAGLMFLLTAPVVVLWRRPARRLGWITSITALLSLVSAELVTSLFTGFLSPLAGGFSLQADYVEPILGESISDYDQVRGLGIAVWTTATLVAGFTLIWVRFRLKPGLTFLGFVLLSAPAPFVIGDEFSWDSPVRPLVVGYAFAGLVAELLVGLMGKPTLTRAGASATGFIVGAVLWWATFAGLDRDGRLLWTPALWGGTVTMSALVGAAVAALVALPAPKSDGLAEGILGPGSA